MENILRGQVDALRAWGGLSRGLLYGHLVKNRQQHRQQLCTYVGGVYSAKAFLELRRKVEMVNSIEY